MILPKSILLLIVSISFSLTIHTQSLGKPKLKAYFERKFDTIYSDTKKEISHTFKIIVPNQSKFKAHKIEFSIIENELSPPNSEIYLPNDRSITVINQIDTIKKVFSLILTRNNKDDRLIIIKLNAFDKNGKAIALIDSNILYKIYIKPLLLNTLTSVNKSFSEKLKAYFEKEIDTLYSNTEKEPTHTFKVIVPLQSIFKDITIGFSIIKNDISPSDSEILIPNERTIHLRNQKDTIKKLFSIKINRNTDDRLIILQLNAQDSAGKSITLLDSNIQYKIYIKPLSNTPKSSGEKIKAYFENQIDTLKSNDSVEISHLFKIIIPNQPNFKDARIDFVIQENEFTPDKSYIYFPYDKSIKIGSSTDTIRRAFIIKFPRSVKDDRLLILKLQAFSKTGESINLIDSNIVYKIYIKPIDLLNTKTNYEFWFFTGTNVDPLDGVKLRELYFKGNYFVNLNPNKKSSNFYLNINFGKNRYFSNQDSLTNRLFNELDPQSAFKDTFKLVNGFYSSFKETSTDNIFSMVEIYKKIHRFSTNISSLYFTSGFYFGLQEIKTTYRNSGFVSDTNSYFRKDTTVLIIRRLKESKTKQINYALNFGFTHILTTDKVNVKTQLITGINIFQYPFNSESLVTRYNGINYYSQLETPDVKRTFTKWYGNFRLEGTILNPGISLGFETFLRNGEAPLFNISLTKIITIDNLSSLFGKVPTINN